MGLWQRLLTTFVAMLIASFVIGLASEAWLGFTLPTYPADLCGRRHRRHDRPARLGTAEAHPH